MLTALPVVLAFLDFTVPGYAWILVSGIAKRLSLVGKVACSFLLSFCFLSLLTAGLSILTTNYLPYAAMISLIPLVVIAAFIPRQRFGPFEAKVGRELLPIVLVLAVYSVIILLHFWSAPFYPDAITGDPSNHAQVVADILRAEGRNVLLQSTYPTGLHFAVALFANLTSLTAIQALRVLVSFVTLAALTLAYESSQVVFGSRRLASYVLLSAAFVIPVDPNLFISLGLYTNLAADAIVLFILWLIFSYVTKPTRQIGATLAFLTLSGLFIHTSVLLFVGVIWAFVPFVFFLFRQKFRAYLEVALYSISLVVLFAVLVLPIFGGNFARVLGYARLNRPITVRVFSAVYLTLWIGFQIFAGSVATAAIGVAIILYALRYRSQLGRLLMIVWTTLLMAGAFLTSEAWRFVLFALLPGYFLVGNLVSSSSKLVGKATILGKRSSQLIPVVVLLFLAASGTFPSLVARAYNPVTRTREVAVFDSMQWLSQNGCAAGVLSVGLGPDYMYLNALTGLHYVGDYDESATAALNQSARLGFQCVAVSAQDTFLPTFESIAAFEWRYRNSFVVIFLITKD